MKLKTFYFISNGFFTGKILSQLEIIKAMCVKQGVKLHVSFSVDGINEMQDFHRGHKDAFQNANETITRILQDKKRFLDGINIICTITRHNIVRINEVQAWADTLGLDAAYNIATENVRIENADKVKDFSIFSDEHAKMLAQEFFYTQYRKTRSEKYFALYLFIRTGKRYAPCPCMFNDWITLTPDSQIGFCATHSKNLGSGLERSAYSIVQENLGYLEELKKKYCSSCSHYMYSLNLEGCKLMFADQYKNSFLR